MRLFFPRKTKIAQHVFLQFCKFSIRHSKQGLKKEPQKVGINFDNWGASRHFMRVNARDARSRRAAHVGVSPLTEFSYRCDGLKKPVSGISEKLMYLMKSNFCALLKVDELHRTFILISSVFIFV